MHGSRFAFAFMLLAALVPTAVVVQSPVSTNSYSTVTSQVTTTELYTLPIATQYVTSAASTYVYGPEAFTIQAGTFSFCYDRRVNFTAAQGQQFHFQWATTQIPPLTLDFYVATQSAVSGVWYCDNGPASLYSKSGASGSVDWVAPSAGQYVALLVNNNPSAASETFSIETPAINTATSISYATATTTILAALTTTISQAGLLAVLGNFGTVGLGILVGAIAVSCSVVLFIRRRKTGPPTFTAKPELPVQAQLLEEPPPVPPSPPLTPTPNERFASVPEKSPAVPFEAGPISTGYAELDQMLSGGLPERYAVLFASPSFDERELLLIKIIESNLSSGTPSFFVSGDVRKIEDMLGKYRSNFYAFCPQASNVAPGHVNLFNVARVENLSDFNISLTMSLRGIPVRQGARKIMIIDILSDVLLHHKLLTTHRWLSDFLTRRKADGFTILATFNPLIAAREEAQTIIDSFDGVIEIYEKELKERARRFLTIKKMYGLRYSETELMLDKNKLY